MSVSEPACSINVAFKFISNTNALLSSKCGRRGSALSGVFLLKGSRASGVIIQGLIVVPNDLERNGPRG